ncbi:hemerythrin domain-containing protein [Glycomyces arizonensis]|uniref:hemerythrin domain-containing protein n=1 Tax=Glycomyces arizonensis TaxID=256035 RepID=UPI00040E2979|nr:hemerythrin domain-containing protein [Glycomyces arizonensis]
MGVGQVDDDTRGSTISSETDRLVAFSGQLRAVHRRLRRALELARQSIDGEVDLPAGLDLPVFCRGFCSALSDHHRSEDTGLFPELLAARPDLRPVVDNLMRDHNMLEHLLGEFSAALSSEAEPEALHRHLDGIGAIMESHFGYEEHQLISVLDAAALHGDPRTLLGDLA